MKGTQSYQWAITPLSPIHIGCGQVYEPTNYVVDRDLLHEFDPSAVADALSPRDRDELLRIVSQRGSTQMILAVQRFFMNRKAGIIPHALQKVPLSMAVAELYRDRVGRVAADQGAERQIFNRLAIDRTAFLLQSRAPYLPGSSIKGAIRTALLHRINRGHAALSAEMEDNKNGGLHKLQSRLLDYNRDNRQKLELDPLRQVRIGDAIASGSQPPARRVYMATNRRKVTLPRRDQENGQRPREGSPDQYLECVLPQLRAFCSEIELQDLKSSLGTNGDRWADRIPSRSFDMQEIAQSCNTFYRSMLENEIQEMQQHELLDTRWVAQMQQVLQDADALMRTDRGFLLRVGRHSGAESMTLPGMRHIKIMKGPGKPPETKDHATTWWMGAERDKAQQKGLLPFGWIFVEVREWQPRMPEWGNSPIAIGWTPPPTEPETVPEAVLPAEMTWTHVRLKYNRANGAITAEGTNGLATAIRPESDQIMAGLPKELQKTLAINQCFVKFKVIVRERILLSVEPE